MKPAMPPVHVVPVLPFSHNHVVGRPPTIAFHVTHDAVKADALTCADALADAVRTYLSTYAPTQRTRLRDALANYDAARKAAHK